MKKIKNRIIIWTLLLLISAIAGAVYWQASTRPSKQVVSGLLVKMDISTLSKKADTILIGRVKNKLPSSEDNNEARLSKVYTDVIITADKFLKNPQESTELKVRLAGGETENAWVWVENEAKLEPGEQVLIFLTKDPEAAGVWTVTGHAQGKYKISGNNVKHQLGGEEMELDKLEQEIAQSLSE